MAAIIPGMDATKKPRRVIFLDLLRALAVMMMIVGHTIDTLLLNEYRSYDYLGFKLWQFARGMTAPIFLLTAGTVFVYLLRSTALPLRDNPRVAKGVKRSLLLFAFGYLLRFPSSSLIGAFSMPIEQWSSFWIVDVLQLIGMALLLLLSAAFLAEKLKLNELALFGAGGAFFFVCAPFCETIVWNKYLPAPIAAYFYSGTGSLFPLFPWAGYVMFGGMLGIHLSRNSRESEPFRLSSRLIVAGTALLALYYCAGSVRDAGYGPARVWDSSPDLVLLRLGSILLLIIPVVLFSARVRDVPAALLAIGRRTLPIYLLHLVVLYGSPWNQGLNRLCDRCLSPLPSMFAAALMLIAMIGFAVGFGMISSDIFSARLGVPQSANPQQLTTDD